MAEPPRRGAAVSPGEGEWEMLCLHPPGSGVRCCNISCSFGPKRGTELTTDRKSVV